MKAIVYDTFGGPEVLDYREMPDPAPGPGEVLVDLRAASVIPADWKLRAGHLTQLFNVTFPKIPGRDGCGIVRSVGPGVDYAAVGDRVCVVAQHSESGTHAQRIVRDAESVVPMPAEVGFAEAAALMHAGICAWICLVETVGLAPGQRILIHGGAGAIGGLGVQLARHLGAEVAATCRSSNRDYVLDMGAHEAIAYDKTDFALGAARRYDVVFDLIGGEVHRRSYEVLKPGGHMVCLRAAPYVDLSERYGVTVSLPMIHDSREALDATVGYAEAGVFRPQIAARMPLERGAEAQRMLEAGQVSRGRIVLEMPEA
jgi:NADPH:quinone reductase-like Zn-dependent oxidoreductase